MFDMTREEKVAEFLKAAGKKDFAANFVETELILNLIYEEWDEFTDAAWNFVEDPTNEEYRAQLCKEWADLQYVVSQAAVFFKIPAGAAFNRVHDSNMTKVGEEGKIIFREDGKILKPDTYRAPDMKGL